VTDQGVIPIVDMTALWRGGDVTATDRAILAAGADPGFLVLTGLPDWFPAGPDARLRLLRVFDLPPEATRRLWRRKFDPTRPNIYRGWFPLQAVNATWKEGIDIGPDVARPVTHRADDPLTEPTPLPNEADLPGWRADAAAYHRACERLGGLVMAALARALGLAADHFVDAFRDGISTLRLIRYPPRPPEVAARVPTGLLDGGPDAAGRAVIGAPHVDSGFVTLLAQDGVEGLQARGAGGWIDVPPREGTLVVNFGALLARWTGGRVAATEHRVLSPGRMRHALPFFLEPGVEAVIAPPPGLGAPDFAPFAYGDHLWAAMTRFVEFRGLEDLRRPRGVAAPEVLA
jgi:isopenicillin N synthase-like dioxygenase